MDLMGRFSTTQVLEGWARLAASPVHKRPPIQPKPAKSSRPYNGVKRLVIRALEQEHRFFPAEICRRIKGRNWRNGAEVLGEVLPMVRRTAAKWRLRSGRRGVSPAR